MVDHRGKLWDTYMHNEKVFPIQTSSILHGVLVGADLLWLCNADPFLCCRKGSAMWHQERINSCKKVLYIHQHAFSPELGVSGLMTQVELYILLEQNIKG
jgi:hypothetical protein